MKRTMTTKSTHSAPAGKNDPVNPADRQRHVDQKGGRRREPVENIGNDHLRDSTKDSAEYIAVLASQLQRIAETNGHEFLAYLIDMVVLEAWRIAGPDADHPIRKPMVSAAAGFSTRYRVKPLWHRPCGQISETRLPG